MRSAVADAAAIRRKFDETGLLIEDHISIPFDTTRASRFSHALSLCSFGYGQTEPIESHGQGCASFVSNFA